MSIILESYYEFSQAPNITGTILSNLELQELRRQIINAFLQGGEDCDLYFQHSASTSVALSDGKVSSIEFLIWVSSSCGRRSS